MSRSKKTATWRRGDHGTVGRVSPQAENYDCLAQSAHFHKAMLVARAGLPRNLEIGRAVELEVRKSGFSVIRESAATASDERFMKRLTCQLSPIRKPASHEGRLVITVEPIISSGSGRVFTDKDVGQYGTGDRALSAHRAPRL